MVVFPFVTLFGRAVDYQRFSEVYFDFRPEDGGCMFFRNVGNNL